MEGTEGINWVHVEVIKECGYHDNHAVGETINVDEHHLNEMLHKGYIKLRCHSCGTAEKVNAQARVNQQMKPLCYACLSGIAH